MTQRILALHLRFNLKWEYSGMCGFVGEMMSPAIVIYNSLFLCGPQGKEALICQKLELVDGSEMKLLMPWRDMAIVWGCRKDEREDIRKGERRWE